MASRRYHDAFDIVQGNEAGLLAPFFFGFRIIGADAQLTGEQFSPQAAGGQVNIRHNGGQPGAIGPAVGNFHVSGRQRCCGLVIAVEAAFPALG